MARTFGRCIGCGDTLYEPDFRTCSRCAVLLDGLLDEGVIVEPPPPTPAGGPGREPGCDDKPKPKRDARWLLWAANKCGCLRFFQAFGREHGYPRNMLQWSPGMAAIAVEAKVAELQPR